MRLRTKNQLPRLHGSALTVPGVWGGFLPIIMSLPTIVEAELGYDNFPIGSKISLCKAGVMLFSCLF